MIQTLLGSALLCMIITTNADAADEICISNAESEYYIPSGLLSLMKGSESSQKLYGPMGLSQEIIHFAAKGINTTEDDIKNIPCENYRAAAWLLMNKFGGKESFDIFTAVNRYYYGFSSKRIGPVTLRIKNQYYISK